MSGRDDEYDNFAQLAADNEFGVDYVYSAKDRAAPVVVAAPHGGTIERGTSELAVAIAGKEHSLYLFEGLVPPREAWALHISSHRFDAPGCRPLLEAADFAVAVHGEKTCPEPVAFLGGLDANLVNEVGGALLGAGFDVRLHPNPLLQGEDEENICNLGSNGGGIQFELSRPLRRLFFASLTRAGRRQPTALFHEFVAAVRSCL